MTHAGELYIHHLDNGITLIGERVEDIASVAFSIMVPLGAAGDPVGQEGAAVLLAEMFNKGAGSMDARELASEFERLGVERGHSAGIEVTTFSGAVLGENIEKALSLYATMLLEPSLPPDELESVKQLAIHELRALEDEPSSKVMVELATQYYPEPFGRNHLGTVDGVKAQTSESLREYFKTQFVPEGAIIGIAGNFDWHSVKNIVEKLFSGWKGSKPLLEPGPVTETSATFHLPSDSSQLQIALAYPSVPMGHADYYNAKTAVGVLSGGMAGRLFIEVREKRGLVYRVSASHSSSRRRAGVFCYAGTTPENGEETLSVMLTELRNLKNGVSNDELERAAADLKARALIHLESSSVRASRLVNDWWHIKRIRDIEEIRTGIDAVTNETLKKHLAEWPVSPITLATLGSKELELTDEVL